MVSNDEITLRLQNRRVEKSLNKYLVCNNCGGYYELQPDESWKDFDTECECGGQLVQSTSDSMLPGGLSEEEYEHKKYETEIIIAYIALFFFWPLCLILTIHLITRQNSRAKLHGKILLLVSIIPIFIIGISALLIYRAYFSQPAIDPSTDVSSVRTIRVFATLLNQPI